jgi:acyl carrier protein
MATRLSNSQQQRWASQGITPITPDKGRQTLEKLLGQSYAQIGVITINWGEFAQQFSTQKIPFLISELVNSVKQQSKPLASHTQKPLIREQWHNVSPAEQEQKLITYLQSTVAYVLGLNAQQMDNTQPLNSLGLDSLMTVELKNRLQADLGVDIPIAQFIEGITISDLVKIIQPQLHDSQVDNAIISQPEITSSESFTNQKINLTDSVALLEQIEQLTDEQVDAWLRSLLFNQAMN